MRVGSLAAAAILWTLLLVTLPIEPLWGQSPQKIANINKKVLGKWWSSDRKDYIEFFSNGVCAEGAFYGGTWHIQQGKLGAWKLGENFICQNGALALIAPNILTRYHGAGGESARYYRGLQQPKPVPPLTLALARRILIQNINMRTVNNTLLTCHACYDPMDKGDNDKAPLVSTYSVLLSQFLTEHGYIRTSGGRQVFTAKAKRSKYYEVDKGFAGFRFVSFKSPRLLTSEIVDPTHVALEYDFVPTELTMSLFGKIQRIKSFASFAYENEAWRMCLACNH